MKLNDNVTAFATVDLTETINNLYSNDLKSKIAGVCIVAAGVVGLWLIRKHSEKIDRLEEEMKTLKDDYHNYVIDHSEYNPDKDNYDWEEDLEEDDPFSNE